MKLSERGFTLIELCVVIAIIGMLSAFAIPSFFEWRQVASRREIASDAARLLMQARARAISRNERVTVTFTLDGGAENQSNRCTISSPSMAIAEVKELADGIEIRGKKDCTLTNGDMAIRFNPDGSAFVGDGAYLCVYSGDKVRFSVGVISSTTGRVVTRGGPPPLP